MKVTNLSHKAAAGYIRMSTGKQEASPERQRKDIINYARRHGYRIVAWFQDDGQTGVGSADDREEWKRCIKGIQRGEFQYIIGWVWSRFTRSDTQESAIEMWDIREAGGILVMTDTGELDMNTEMGRMQAFMKAAEANAYSKAIGQATVSWQEKKAAKGLWPCGQTPPGMDKDEDDRLCPSEDKTAIDEIRECYRLAERGHSHREIRNRLFHKFDRQRTAGWISKVLRDRNYTGDFVWPRTNQGKFNKVTPEGPESVDLKSRGRMLVAQKRFFVPDNHKGIISKDQFDHVQDILAERRTDRTPVRNGGNYLLNKLMRCKHCGSPMVGYKTNTTKTKHYICGWRLRKGDVTCLSRSLPEETILRHIIRALREELTEDRLQSAEREMKKRIRTAKKESPDKLKSLRAKSKQLDKKIAVATDRYLELSNPALQARAEVKLNEMQEELERVTAEIELVESSPKQASQIMDEAALLSTYLNQLEELLLNPSEENIPLLRQLLREFIEVMVVDIEATPQPASKGKRQRNRYQLVGGTIALKSGKFKALFTQQNIGSNELILAPGLTKTGASIVSFSVAP